MAVWIWHVVLPLWYVSNIVHLEYLNFDRLTLWLCEEHIADEHCEVCGLGHENGKMVGEIPPNSEFNNIFWLSTAKMSGQNF